MYLDKAISKFINHLGRKSENTRLTYLAGIQRFMEFLAEQQGYTLPEDQGQRALLIQRVTEKTPAKTLTTEDVIDFANWLDKRGLAAKSCETYLTAVSRFYFVLMKRKVNGFTGEDYMLLKDELKDRRGKDERRAVKMPSEETVSTLLEVAHGRDDDNPRLHLLRLRDRAVVGTWRQTACRISEVANMKREDLDHERKAATVIGKGNKERSVFFWEAWDDVQAYLKARDAHHLELVEDKEPLFASHDLITWHHQQLRSVGSAALRIQLYKLCNAAGVPKTKPHGFRHYRATEIQRQKGDIALTQETLGHADISTTKNTYVHLNDDDLYDELRKLKEES